MNKVFFAFILFSSVSIAQSGYVGFKMEMLTYWERLYYNGSVRSHSLPPFASIYFKLNLFYQSYEFELKGGIQLDEIFVGPEYGFALKYDAGKKFFPLISYLNHYTSSDGSHNGGGTATGSKEFIGAGVELRVTRVFGLDLIYYYPIGDDHLSYGLEYWEIPMTKKYNKIVGMLKLGFIFNIGAPKLTI